MKKNLIAGLFAVGLIAAGGTGFALANTQEKTQDPVYLMEQGMGGGQMTQMMNTTNTGEMQQFMQNQNVSFEEMLPYMKKMHPDLSDEQLKALFEQMHGQNGACSNSNGQGMMGSTNKNFQ